MNMQIKLDTIKFFSPPNDLLCSQTPNSNCRTCWFPRVHKFHKFSQTCKFYRTWRIHRKRQNSRNTLNSQKKKISWNPQKGENLLPPGQPPFKNWAWHPLYGIFPLASLGWLPGYSLSQLLHTCSLAQHGALEKAIDFLTTTKNISVISILLILNPNHSRY